MGLRPLRAPTNVSVLTYIFVFFVVFLGCAVENFGWAIREVERVVREEMTNISILDTFLAISSKALIYGQGGHSNFKQQKFPIIFRLSRFIFHS